MAQSRTFNAHVRSVRANTRTSSHTQHTNTCQYSHNSSSTHQQMNTKAHTYTHRRETAPAKPGTDAFRWGTKQAGSNCPADEQLLILLGESSMGFADFVDVSIGKTLGGAKILPGGGTEERIEDAS